MNDPRKISANNFLTLAAMSHWNGGHENVAIFTKKDSQEITMKYGATWNVAISDMVWCGMRLECKLCDVEYGVMSWYVGCYIMQDVESYDGMWNVVVWNCGGEECGICNVLYDCCVMTDVENNAMCCDVRCGGVM